RLGRSQRTIDDMPGDAAAETRIAAANDAAERAWRHLDIALARGEPTHRLHAAETRERVGVGGNALFVDHARERRNFDEPALQSFRGKGGAPVGEAFRSERRIE